MVLILFIIFLLITIACCIIGFRIDADKNEGKMMILVALGIFSFCGVFGIILSVLIDLTPALANEKIIDKKIVIYQEENNKLEKKIMVVAKTYMDFEKDIYKDLDNESVITLVETYPDLKSNQILMEEINTYKENSKQIKALKTEKLEIKKTKWIYYFG